MTSPSDTLAPAPMRIEVALMLPLSLASEIARQVGSALRPLQDTLRLFPRLVVALEQIAETNQAIIALGESSANIARLADATVTLERLADAGPVLEQLAAATTSLEQLARLAETSGQIEKLANATVVAPLQGTAERVGRFWNAATRAATGTSQNGSKTAPVAPPVEPKPRTRR
jgi:hypothetical protein